MSGGARSEPASGSVGTDELRRLPKVELHVHLEGSFDAARIVELAGRAGEAVPGDPASLFDTSSLSAFLARLDWWCSLVRTPEDAAAQAYGFARRLGDDGVAYAEVALNPTHWRALGRSVLIEAVADGFQRAAADGGADCGIVVSLARWQGEADARALVDELGRSRPERVVALGVDGDEAASGPTGERFREAFAEAARIGLGCTAHAGESSGPDGVREALDVLGAERIDHGVRAAEDADLLRRIADEGVVLNCCPTSNARLLYGSLEAVPLEVLSDAGVRFTVNTDDPVLLATTLSEELEHVAARLHLGLDGVLALEQVALEASFADTGRRDALSAALRGG